MSELMTYCDCCGDPVRMGRVVMLRLTWPRSVVNRSLCPGCASRLVRECTCGERP